MATGGPHRDPGDLERRLGEAGKDATGVKPAHAEFTEQVIPVDVVGLQRGGRGVGAVVHAARRAHTEAALGEVERGSMVLTDIVGRLPDDMVEVDSTLEQEVFEQSPHLVVADRGHQRCPLPETPTERAPDVVLPTPFGDAEGASRTHAPFPGVEAQHHFADRHDVEAALLGGPDGQSVAHVGTRVSSTAAAAAAVTEAQSAAATADGGTIHDPPMART